MNTLPKIATQFYPNHHSNPSPHDCKSNALTVTPLHHSGRVDALTLLLGYLIWQMQQTLQDSTVSSFLASSSVEA